MFCKRVFLEISQTSQENTCVRASFLIKLQSCNFIKKETLAQVFPCELCEISKNTFSYITPPVAASDFCNVSFPLDATTSVKYQYKLLATILFFHKHIIKLKEIFGKIKYDNRFLEKCF